ncbi:TetR/AcrR family transcriptional regulator [Salinisphaera orenii]|uniref:TetR family transcriptional regulator n=1 Tax=Salinisphaera orenii YIM 95161 TaxID=1051139 RepID=A0A423Q2X7_9GAMM|nr:TetR/AcrR family transcriptional regulator [Salinisphaera halophila]ROO33007.1 TetR family transcriptional regulator [Salinisphaera halophila YIM 95161]
MAQPAAERSSTRERVRATAFRLFGRFGYDGVSMLAVARGAGVTKAALYWHYENKADLYAACMRQLVGLFEERVFEAAAAEPDPVERIFALFAGLQQLVDDERVVDGVAGYWLRPASADVSAARAVQAEFEAGASAAIEAVLEEARAADALQIEGSAEDFARAFIAIMEAIVLPMGNRGAPEHRRVVAVLARTFFQAHARTPGLAERAARGLGAPAAAPAEPSEDRS